MPKQLLTFELDRNNEQIFIHGDAEGLRALAKVLSRLAEKAELGRTDHDHLMTEEWSGNELSSTAQGKETKLIHHVKIYGMKSSIEKDL